MNQPSIFSSALGLSAHWQITAVDVSHKDPRLDIYINYQHSASTPCPSCGEVAKICGFSDESWLYADFFNKEAFLHVKVPVINCHLSCGCVKLNVPWSHPGSRFILQKNSLATACVDCDKLESMKSITLA